MQRPVTPPTLPTGFSIHLSILLEGKDHPPKEETEVLCTDHNIAISARCLTVHSEYSTEADDIDQKPKSPQAISEVEFFDIFTDYDSEVQSTCSTFESTDVECGRTDEDSVASTSGKVGFFDIYNDYESQIQSTGASFKAIRGVCRSVSKPESTSADGKVKFFNIYSDSESETQSTCSTFDTTDVELIHADLSSGDSDTEFDYVCRTCAERAPAMCRTCADSTEDRFCTKTSGTGFETKAEVGPSVDRILKKLRGCLPQTDVEEMKIWAERDKAELERVANIPVPSEDLGKDSL